MQLSNMLKYKMDWASPQGAHHKIALSSRIRLARNLQDYPFTNCANPKSLSSILHESFEAARKSKRLSLATYLKLEDLEEVDRLFLVERHLISRDLASEFRSRGVVVGYRESLSLMINEEDHLRLQGMGPGFSLREVWSQVNALDEDLSQRLDFASHPEWGYLTACPTNTGTGLRASCLVHLPALTLTNQIGKLLQGLARVGMVARGFYGEGTQAVGDFYQISNAQTLGHSETEFIANIEEAVKNVLEPERECLKALLDGPQRIRMEDLCYRALGILSHARAISYEEAMQRLSHIRMALNSGWEMPADLGTLNELVILCQPAHIQMLAQKELSPAERDVFRASLLRKKLQGK